MRMHRIGLLCAVVTLALAACGGGGDASNPVGASVAPTPTADKTRVSERLSAHPKGEADAPAGYYAYLPPGYGDGTPRPLLVALHGYGESGDGSAAQLRNLLAKDSGIPWLIRADRWPSNLPFVVLAPQHAATDGPAYAACEQTTRVGDCSMKLQHDRGNPVSDSPCFTPSEVHAFLTFAIGQYDVDPGRVYLTGLSCGALQARRGSDLGVPRRCRRRGLYGRQHRAHDSTHRMPGAAAGGRGHGLRRCWSQLVGVNLRPQRWSQHLRLVPRLHPALTAIAQAAAARWRLHYRVAWQH
jgi:hypothetical protein